VNKVDWRNFMFNKKKVRIISTAIVIILVFAMVIPMVLAVLL
jgi:hypothetical protein